MNAGGLRIAECSMGRVRTDDRERLAANEGRRDWQGRGTYGWKSLIFSPRRTGSDIQNDGNSDRTERSTSTTKTLIQHLRKSASTGDAGSALHRRKKCSRHQRARARWNGGLPMHSRAVRSDTLAKTWQNTWPSGGTTFSSWLVCPPGQLRRRHPDPACSRCPRPRHENCCSSCWRRPHHASRCRSH